MKKLLFIETSPRKSDSITTDVSQKLISRLQEQEPWDVEVLDLWNVKLPHMNGTTMAAKYAVFSGNEMSPEQQESWMLLNDYIKQFGSADLIVIAAPMWNWGVPYVLKHYIDVVTQPQLTFDWTPEDGYIPLLPPRDAVIVTSSGGDFTTGSGNEHEDYAFRYLRQWLENCMGCRVDSIDMTMTATGPEAIELSYQRANDKMDSMLGAFSVA